MKLSEVLPVEFTKGEYCDTPAFKLKDLEVKESFSMVDETYQPWPGPQKNVMFWVILANNKRVGWNEGPRGWSFPVLGPRKI